MSTKSILGASVGKANPAPQPQEKFFQQFVTLPPAFQGSPWQIIGLEQSGISPRDYFAAHALLSCNGSFYKGELATAREVAEWCYRVADAMVKARRKSENPVGENGLDGSTFHEDYQKKIAPDGK